jgi:hypothetical protein
MRVDETPFPPGWWGQGLADVRPKVGTYGRYPQRNLPPLPFELRGDFAWLGDQKSRTGNIAREKRAENAEALSALPRDAAGKGLILPTEFLEFQRSPDLQRRIRSCADCFLDLSPVFVASPIADGFLLRFLADSQGCLFWYLYVRPGTSDHCVVASPDFFGVGAEQWRDAPPDPEQIVFCEESFERFLCRFWLENEIWYCDYEKRPLFAVGRRYLESYGGTA